MTEIFESGEMYLEDILILKNKLGDVRSIDIANFTGYSKPSVSRALGILKKNEYVLVDEKGYITLTEKGLTIAAKIYERHNILTAFFESIGVAHDVAAADACKIEHDISDETFEKIKEHAKAGGNKI